MDLRLPTFGEWLTKVVQEHELAVKVSGAQRRTKTWSERLAAAMKEGSEYDSYLRRVARGTVTPRFESTYKIGCGLRAAGLRWCSGALALMHNPKTYLDLVALIDIASRDQFDATEVWMFFANEATSVDSGHRTDDEFSSAILTGLANYTDLLDPVMNFAFAEYQKRGVRRAVGLLGIANLVGSEPRFGPRANDVVALILKQWRFENQRDQETLTQGLALAKPRRR